jgi:hypothetical protein
VRRIKQTEAKADGVFIESFDSPEDFQTAQPNLDKIATRMKRDLAYIVIPFASEHFRIVQYQVYLMPKDYKFE